MALRYSLVLLLSGAPFALAGCGSGVDSDSELQDGESGGSQSAAGGNGATGGGTSVGGTMTSGGATNAGGTTSTGGMVSGGESSTGGDSTGGVNAGAGGDGGSGGGSGGAPGAGGDASSGGMSAAGGSSGSGSLGCGMSSSRPDPRTQQSIQVGSLTRYYLMYVPENFDPNVPLSLVFAVHGLNMNNVWAAHDSSGFQLIENTNDQAILVYPQGIQANGQSVLPSTESQWGTADSNWGGPPPNANPDRLAADLEYFDAMLEFVSDNYCVDLDRVFAMGFSQGGFMTNALGCERSSVYRGLGPVAGWGPIGSNPSCGDATAVHAVIQTQGDTDGTVTPQLGQATRDFWLERAGCGTSSSPSSFGQGCVEYEGCADGQPVIYCTHGGDHFVPDGAGPRAWDFFQSLD